MTQFPNSPSVGDKVTFNDATYEWDGNRWKSLGTIAVGPTGATGPAGSGGGGVSAGSGLTLNGSTLGIDPTAIVHVAGVSSDGDLNVGGNLLIPNGNYFGNDTHGTVRIASNRVEIKPNNSTSNALTVRNTETRAAQVVVTEKGISMDASGITFPDGTFQSSAASGSGSGVTGADGTSVGYTAGNTAPVGSATGDFWYENDTGLYYANVFDGTTLGWLQISGIDGVTGPTGPAGQDGAGGGGGTTLAAGAGMTLSTTVAGVGHTLGIDPTAIVHVAGISADGGITAGGVSKFGRVTINDHEIKLLNGGGIDNTSGAKVYFGTSELGLFPQGSSNQGLSISTARTKAFQVIHAVGGISADAGITFPDGTYQDTAATGSTITAGAGMTLAGSTLGIDPTATIHVAGISADGGITVGGELRAVSDIVFNGGSAIQNDSGSRNSYIYFEDGNNGQIRFRPDNMPGFSITRSEGVIVDSGVRFRSNPIAEFLAGISLDVGITFPDGTFQSTAASGSGVTAGAGMVLTGSTLGIDPTAIVHVAGISADGGVTASGNIKTAGRLVADVVQSEDNELSRYGFEINDSTFSVNTGNNDRRARIDSNGIHAENGRIKANTFVEAGTYVHAGTGVSLDAGGITFADGTFQNTAGGGGVTGPTGPTGGNGPAGSTGPTGSGIGPTVTVTGGTGGPDASWISSAATGDFYIEVVN